MRAMRCVIQSCYSKRLTARWVKERRGHSVTDDAFAADVTAI